MSSQGSSSAITSSPMTSSAPTAAQTGVAVDAESANTGLVQPATPDGISLLHHPDSFGFTTRDGDTYIQSSDEAVARLNRRQEVDTVRSDGTVALQTGSRAVSVSPEGEVKLKTGPDAAPRSLGNIEQPGTQGALLRELDAQAVSHLDAMYRRKSLDSIDELGALPLPVVKRMADQQMRTDRRAVATIFALIPPAEFSRMLVATMADAAIAASPYLSGVEKLSRDKQALAGTPLGPSPTSISQNSGA